MEDLLLHSFQTLSVTHCHSDISLIQNPCLIARPRLRCTNVQGSKMGVPLEGESHSISIWHCNVTGAKWIWNKDVSQFCSSEFLFGFEISRLSWFVSDAELI